MNNFPVSKASLLCAPAAKLDDAAATVTVIDTINVKYVVVTAVFGDVDATAAVLSVSHSDVAASTTALTGGAVISGSDLASSVTGAAGDNKIVRWYIRPTKRYLLLAFTAGNGALGTYFTAIADSFMDETPDSDTERGVLISASLS